MSYVVDRIPNGPLACRWLAVSLLGFAVHAQSLLTVDITGATPGSFTHIQLAINAAADGDVILVKSGFYSNGSFDVNDKALTIIEDAGATVSAVSARITNPNGKTIAIRGIEFRRNSPGVLSLNPGRNLHVIDNTGAVWIEDCTFGTVNPLLAAAGPAYPAIEVANATGVGGTLLLARCTVAGSRGVRTPSGMMEAGVAIRASTNVFDRLVMHACVVDGGNGAAGFVGTNIAGGDGANAIEASNGYVFLSGGTVTGGNGGNGGGGTGCTAGGSGGDALAITGVAFAEVLGTVHTGGAAGSATGACTPGVAGVPFQIAPTAMLTIHPAGTPHSIEVTSPVRDNTSTTAVLRGEVLAASFPHCALGTGSLLLPGMLGPVALDPASVFSLGVVLLDAAGSGTAVYPLNNVVPAGAQVVVAYLQSLQLGASTMVIGAPSLLVVVQ